MYFGSVQIISLGNLKSYDLEGSMLKCKTKWNERLSPIPRYRTYLINNSPINEFYRWFMQNMLGKTVKLMQFPIRL